MNADELNQQSLNFFRIAQRLGATMAPSLGPRDQGIGMQSPTVAGQGLRAAGSREAFCDQELPTAKLEQLFEQACGVREYRPEALLWNKELAKDYFRLVDSQLGTLPKREITRHLVTAYRLRASGNRAWEHPRRPSSGCEPAVEWALCRIRYACGDSLRDILDVICDPQLGEAFDLLARAMAPQPVRELPLQQARSLLFCKAYGLQRSRTTRVRTDSLPDEQAPVGKLIAGRLRGLSNIAGEEAPQGQGLVQLNDGEQCLFCCYASDVRATVAEIASGTALRLLARHYWAIDFATLRIGHALADEVASVSGSLQATSRDRRSMLQRFERLLIAHMQPTFNWPVTFAHSRDRHQQSQ